MAAPLLALAAMAGAVAGCGGSPRAANRTDARPAPASRADAGARSALTIAVLGDSLTAGLGLDESDAYPTVIQQDFDRDGYHVRIVNAGVSGDTTAGGARRVATLLQQGTTLLVVALGGNDALRALTTADTRRNLEAIVSAARAAHVPVLLAGMLAPVNLGEEYRTAFADAFATVARDNRDLVTFVPFLLEGVGGNPALNQADGIHPNRAGAAIVAGHLYPPLRAMVDRMGGGR